MSTPNSAGVIAALLIRPKHMAATAVALLGGGPVAGVLVAIGGCGVVPVWLLVLKIVGAVFCFLASVWGIQKLRFADSPPWGWLLRLYGVAAAVSGALCILTYCFTRS